MVTAQPREFERARRLERSLVAVRWFGVAFAAFQVWQAESLEPRPLHYTTEVGAGLIVALVVGNVWIAGRIRRAAALREFATLGRLAFAFDMAIVIGFIFTYSYTPDSPVWALAYILPLEGAIRYHLGGALVATAVGLVAEAVREWYLTLLLPGAGYEFSLVTFRMGIMLIIALVAGIMSRSQEREAQKAQDRARLAEEAARRATIARRELAAFHAAILAGVAADDPQGSLRAMAETIGKDLRFQCLSILLVEDGHLSAKARYGTPPSHWKDRIPIGTGVAGRVVETGEPLLAPLGPEGGAVAAAPLSVGGEVIGVLEVSSTIDEEVSEETLDVLVRMADQIALVAHSAELRARQQETLERLRELDEMKSDFVAITSHELRTPLTAVRGFVRTLIRNFDRLSTRQIQDFLGLIDRQSERLTRLVEDLLVLSRIEAGTITVAPEPVELREFLRDVAKAFGQRRERIQVEVEDALPEKVVLDPHRVDQVLSNLIQNAIKFSPRGTRIGLTARRAGDRIEFAVRDRGIGISEEELAHIFERFHQAAPALTRETEGAGLGLYITKRLVEAMRGHVGVASEVGVGSTFTVGLPLVTDGAAAPTALAGPGASLLPHGSGPGASPRTEPAPSGTPAD